MDSRRIPWRLVVVAVLGLSNACNDSGSDDQATAGAPNGGSVSGMSGASIGGGPAGGKSAGGTGGTAGLAGAVDCDAVCAHVKVLCPDRADIDQVWLSACQSACDARVKLTPDTALLEQTCVQGAATCNASIVCVATPH